MKNLLNLTESEKTRILNLHKSAIKKEFLFEQRMDAEGKNVEMYKSDNDYDYKKEGDKYFFKLRANPVSKEAKAFLAQKKFINWTEAKGIGLESIKKLQFQAVAPPPPNTDGSDETFEPPVQTTNTATTPTTSNTVNNAPVKYPWIGADGKSSLENLQKAKTADPNFNNWLGELKKLSRQQLSKVQEDLKSFRSQISQSGIDVQSDQSYLVANQAINDAINLIGKTTPTTAAGASATTPLKTGKEIRQDYRQQQRQERQGARQVKKDKKQLEQELKNLQSTYQRLLPKMTPDVKKSYESKIADLIVQVNKA